MKRLRMLTVVAAVAVTMGTGMGLYPGMAMASSLANPANLSGSGSVSQPYLIGTEAELSAFDQNWKSYAGAYLELTTDISLPSPSSGGNYWTPIGTRATPFTGVFDGNGHTITGLTIQIPAPSIVPATDALPVGMFGAVTGTVENLTLSSVKVKSLNPLEAVGGLVGLLGSPSGSSTAALLSNDHVTSGSITSDVTDGSMPGNGGGQLGAGGLLGNNGDLSLNSPTFLGWSGGTVIDSTASVDVKNLTGIKTIVPLPGISAADGGLVGVNDISGTVKNSYALGNVLGYDAGGLIGTNFSTVTDSFANASVGTGPSGALGLGGLIGLNANHGTVSSTYALSPVNPKNSNGGHAGGLVGYDFGGGPVTSSYYDTTTTGMTSSGGGTPEPNSAMMQQKTYSGFDFGKAWSFVSNGEATYAYPFIQTNLNFASPFAGGNGSPTNPYEIANTTQLVDVRDFPSLSFILEADLNLSGTNWQPLGNRNVPFNGTFNGNGHTITGLTIQILAPSTVPATDASPVGLFGAVTGTVENLTLSSVNVNSLNPLEAVGGLVGLLGSPSGSSTAALLSNDHVTSGSITSDVTDGNMPGNGVGQLGAGGLVGNNGDLSLSSSSFSGWSGGTVVDSSASVDVKNLTGTTTIVPLPGISAADGGLLGVNDISGTVKDSYAFGNVIGYDAGGLIGTNFGAVTDSFADVSVGAGPSGALGLGGLIGLNADHSTVSNTYAVGPVNPKNSSGAHVGGLVGYNFGGGPVASSYYDTTTTGMTSSDGGTPEPDSAMMLQKTFVNWAFPAVWSITDGSSYPYFTQLGNPYPNGGGLYGQLPEVPLAGGLPLIGLAGAGALWYVRRRKGQRA